MHYITVHVFDPTSSPQRFALACSKSFFFVMGKRVVRTGPAQSRPGFQAAG